jgi:hypothetical protein
MKSLTALPASTRAKMARTVAAIPNIARDMKSKAPSKPLPFIWISRLWRAKGGSAAFPRY